jgi:hypothetical protein
LGSEHVDLEDVRQAVLGFDSAGLAVANAGVVYDGVERADVVCSVR